MTASFSRLAALLPAAALAACLSGGDDTQTIRGHVDRDGFGGAALGARAVRGDQVIATSRLDAEGRFHLEIPRGTGYRLEIITPIGAYPLFAPSAGVVRTFDVCRPVDPFDMGMITAGGADGCRPPEPDDGCDGEPVYPDGTVVCDDRPPPCTIGPNGQMTCEDPPPPCTIGPDGQMTCEDPSWPPCTKRPDGTVVCEDPSWPCTIGPDGQMTCEDPCNGDPACDLCEVRPNWCWDPCEENPEWCMDPCDGDPACDLCEVRPNWCWDPCQEDPALCDPCLLDPTFCMPPGDDCDYDDPMMCWPPDCGPDGCPPGQCALPQQVIPDFGCLLGGG